MFESTARIAFFDYFRVPYRVATAPSWLEPVIGADYAALWDGDRPRRYLLWPLFDPNLHHDAGDRAVDRAAVLGRYRIGETTVFGRVLPNDALDDLVARWGQAWRVAEPLVDVGGTEVSGVRRDAGGNVVLPFDPGEVMHLLWSEAYRVAEPSGRARALAERVLHTAGTVLPRSARARMLPLADGIQRRADFPAWPVESSLHDLYERLFALVTDVAGRSVPWIDLWPDGHSSALVLTHDVETAAGLGGIGRLREVEHAAGLVSSWNLVPLAYTTPSSVVERLRAEGCEIGVHGLRRDGRDLASWRLFRHRRPLMRDYARRWGAVGFRSPAMQREWSWMPTLGFDYDSSYHDTAPHEAQPGGSCSLLPFTYAGMVELPITLPTDHTLFTVLDHPDASVWWEKSTQLRRRRAMVLVDVRPDHADDPRVLEGYRRLLAAYADDPSVWHALPREVSRWWRERAESSIVDRQRAFGIFGPAADRATIRFTKPGLPALTAGEVRPAAVRSRPR